MSETTQELEGDDYAESYRQSSKATWTSFEQCSPELRQAIMLGNGKEITYGNAPDGQPYWWRLKVTEQWGSTVFRKTEAERQAFKAQYANKGNGVSGGGGGSSSSFSTKIPNAPRQATIESLTPPVQKRAADLFSKAQINNNNNKEPKDLTVISIDPSKTMEMVTKLGEYLTMGFQPFGNTFRDCAVPLGDGRIAVGLVKYEDEGLTKIEAE